MSTTRPPWTAIPARRLSGRDLNFRVNLVLGLLAVAALAGPVALLVSLRPAPPADTTYQMDPVARLAVQAAVDFLAGRPTLVPVAEGVDPTFGQPAGAAIPRAPLTDVVSVTVAGRTDTTTGGEPLVYEGRRFVLVDVRAVGRDGNRWAVSVPVYADGPALAAGVTLLPADETGVLAGALPIDYLTNDAVAVPSETVRAVVAQWAVAYAGGDGDALKRLAGDTEPGRYRGLGGFSVDTSEIVAAVNLFAEDGTVTGQVLRIRLLMRPAGSVNTLPVAAEYDLLVARPTTDLPAITDWGPAGAALADLAAYTNRLPAAGS